MKILATLILAVILTGCAANTTKPSGLQAWTCNVATAQVRKDENDAKA